MNFWIPTTSAAKTERNYRIITALLFLLFLPPQFPFATAQEAPPPINGAALYETHCSACHGSRMEGAQYGPLIKEDWMYGSGKRPMLRTIMYGIVNTEMIAWSSVLTKDQCQAIVDHIIAKNDNPNSEIDVSFPDILQTQDYTVKVEALVTEGFRSSPWGIEFAAANRALITERRGGLRWMIDGKLDPHPIEGIPLTTQHADSGMMDVALHPNYADNGWVYIAYVHPLGDHTLKETPAMTRIIRGRVRDGKWVDQETVFKVSDELHLGNGYRFGCRMLFDREGYLYFTIGDVGRNDGVQKLSTPVGKTFRIHPDGSLPEDNPFVHEHDAIKAIFTIGNRNVQGIDQHPATGELWATEHGPMGGDELNILEKGKNYGWPVITYGINYNGSIVSELTHKEGMEQPIKYWTPSPAIGALEFYKGDLFPKWKNQILIGALAFEEIKLLKIEGHGIVSEEIILKNHGRIREIRTGPDGGLYVLVNNPHAVLRLTPVEDQQSP